MPGFSNSSIQVIESFARDIGVDAIASADGSFTFEFSRSGTMSFTSSEDGSRIILSMARRPQTQERDRERKFFALAGFNPTTNSFLHAGLADDGHLVSSLSCDEREFDLSVVDDAFQQLSGMLDAADIK